MIIKYGKWLSRQFLNGYPQEKIYMMQPDGFIIKGKEHMVANGISPYMDLSKL